MRCWWSVIVHLLSIGVVSTRPVAAQVARPSTRALAEFSRAIDSLRKRVGIPGMSAAIAFNDSVVWSQGYGYADRERGIPAKAQTPYEVASVSKPFGAVLMLRLVQEGKVSLDDPMSKYSTEYHSDSVLVRHVFTHTSSGVPGTAYVYDGDVFATLFDVVVKASGRRYREIVSNDILIPLGMNETSPGNDLQPGQPAMDALLGKANADRYDDVVSRLAKPYTIDSTGTVVPSREYLFQLSPANGIVSTVLDLAKFDRAIDHDVLISPATKRLMWMPARAPDGRAFPYALGWFVQDYDGERVIWHNGNLPNRYSALYLKLPEAGLSLFLLANSDALSMPFKLALGDISSSAFACAFRTIIARPGARAATSCALPDKMINDWRALHNYRLAMGSSQRNE
jgi:CubicO group peptidase (beta-lactamase class C family)